MPQNYGMEVITEKVIGLKYHRVEAYCTDVYGAKAIRIIGGIDGSSEKTDIYRTRRG